MNALVERVPYYGMLVDECGAEPRAATVKKIGLIVAAPFFGLTYIIAFPFVGLAMLAWFGARALRNR